MKFDLSRWDESYFRRLKDFMAEAQKRGVVVEMNLFCPFYEEVLWDANPMNARNNVNGVGKVPRDEVYTLKHADLTAVQEAVARKIVTELNAFDNLYFEVANEPYFGGITLEWQHHVAKLIAETEAKLPQPAPRLDEHRERAAKVESPSPHVSIFNFHYATPPDAVAMNAHLRGVIGENETGFRGKDDVLYRTEGWAFLLAGGGLYNNLDYSFTPAHPDGTFLDYASPGGGQPDVPEADAGAQGLRPLLRLRADEAGPLGRRGARGPRRAGARREGTAVRRLPPRAGRRGELRRPVDGAAGPAATGDYRLTTVSDDGVRLWLDGRLLIENWTDHAPTEDHATVELVAGRPADLKVEYYQGGGGATARLKWTRPDGTTEIVPADRLLLARRQRAGPPGRVLRGAHLRRAGGGAGRPGRSTSSGRLSPRPIARPGDRRGPSRSPSTCPPAATGPSGSTRRPAPVDEGGGPARTPVAASRWHRRLSTRTWPWSLKARR